MFHFEQTYNLASTSNVQCEKKVLLAVFIK